MSRMIMNKEAIATIAPYSLPKSTISSFGEQVDVKRDGNCFFAALWEAKHQYDAKKDNLDMSDHRKKYTDMHLETWSKWC